MTIALTFSLFFSHSDSKCLNQTYRKVEKCQQTDNSKQLQHKQAGWWWRAGKEPKELWYTEKLGCWRRWRLHTQTDPKSNIQIENTCLCLVRQTLPSPSYCIIDLNSSCRLQALMYFPHCFLILSWLMQTFFSHTHTHTKSAFIYLSVHIAPICRDRDCVLLVCSFSSLLNLKRGQNNVSKIICLVILPKCAKDQCVSS